MNPNDKRIIDLQLINAANAQMRIPLWNVDDVTYAILLSTLIPEETVDTASLTWSNVSNYMTDNVVLSDDKFWISLVDNNLNNPPVEGANWHQVNKAASGLVFWQAGLFLNLKATVLYGAPGMVALYYLTVPAPFNSTDFPTELAAGKWGVVGSAAAVGSVDKSIFRFNSDLFTEQSQSFRGIVSGLAAGLTDEILSVSYGARLDAVGVFTPLADLAALQAWVTANVTGNATTGAIFWVKVYATYKAGRSGIAEVQLKSIPS